MEALVYIGPNKKALKNRPKPIIAVATDAIVKVTRTSISGTDLQIVRGNMPTCSSGRILGNEGVGIVDAVGSEVTRFKVGDPVLISCVSACGTCLNCRRHMHSLCTTGGWLLGNGIDGTQAEFVRIPYANTSLFAIPVGEDQEAFVMLSGILPTGFEGGILKGKIQPGNVVAIVGAGPIGLAALYSARSCSAAEIIMIDFDVNRLLLAKKIGATAIINISDGRAIEAVMRITGGLGVDIVIETVGLSASFKLCKNIVASGGTIANIGVHETEVELYLENLWDRNNSKRLVDRISKPVQVKVDPKQLITHRFKLNKILDAYTAFEHAASTKALKVIIET
jgi:alcohol dehydrogenase